MFINTNQLRSFYYASKLRSITLAAQELMVTPPAISVQVKNLEENMGMKLMFRNGNSIELTDIGKTMFKRCHLIFRQIKELEDLVEDLSTGKSGILKIGCPQMPAEYIMPRLIAIFKKTYPGIKMILDQGTSSEMIRDIINHKNELSVVRFMPNDKRLKVKKFASEELVLIAAPGSRIFHNDKISVNLLSTIPLIMRQEGSGTRKVVSDYLLKFKVTPVIGIESASIYLIKELVRQDNGASFLPRSAVIDELKNGNLKAIRILEGSPTIEYGIGYLKRNSLSPGAWAFLRLLDKLDDIIPSGDAL